MPNVFDSFLDGQLVEAGKRQRKKKTDSSVQHYECISEGSVDLLRRTINGGRVRHSPVSRHWLPRPYRTHFFRGFVAYGKDKIQTGRVRLGELAPILAPQTDSRKFGNFDLTKRARMNSTLWVTSCAVGREGRKSFFVHDGLGHNGTSGISSAEKQDVITRLHCQPLRCSKLVHNRICLVVA